MGLCFSRKSVKTTRPSKRVSNNHHHQSNVGSSNRWTRIGSYRKKDKSEDAIIREQALAAALLFQQQNGRNSLLFDRSASVRYPNANSKKQQGLPRSSSSRARSLTDPLLQPHQLVNKVSFYFNFLLSCYNGLFRTPDWGTWKLKC